MTEQFEPGEAGGPGAYTGVPAVDEVLTAIEGLDSLPLEEQVAVFTRAQEQLRGVLDVPGEPV